MFRQDVFNLKKFFCSGYMILSERTKTASNDEETLVLCLKKFFCINVIHS